MISFPKPTPRVLEKQQAKRAKEIQKRLVWAAVDTRDKSRCRACDAWADPHERDSLRRGHRHHLWFRSRGGPDTTANLVLLCATCHAMVHSRRLFIHGDDANTRLRFEYV